MSEVYKPALGAGIGVTIPIVTEYALKGARLGATEEEPKKGYKWSGILGLGLGIPELAIAGYGEKAFGWPTEKEDKALMGAMGGASVVTGASILILDELRKRALYAFKQKKGKGTTLPLTEEGLERVEYPVEELVEEI